MMPVFFLMLNKVVKKFCSIFCETLSFAILQRLFFLALKSIAKDFDKKNKTQKGYVHLGGGLRNITYENTLGNVLVPGKHCILHEPSSGYCQQTSNSSKRKTCSRKCEDS